MVKIKVMVIRYRGTPPSLAVAKWSACTHLIMSPSLRWVLYLLGNNAPQDTILLLELIDLLLEVHIFLAEPACDG